MKKENKTLGTERCANIDTLYKNNNTAVRIQLLFIRNRDLIIVRILDEVWIILGHI
jgi:hypothetical protein